MKVCKECEKRGKQWNGDNPVCGFNNGKFNPENWNCASLNKLRAYCRDHGYSYRDDVNNASIGVFPIPDNDIISGYIVMTWYKSRGRTGRAIVMCDDSEPVILNEEMAEAIIESHERLL